MKPLHTLVEEQLDDYVSKRVSVTDVYEHSQYQTLQQIENFIHSRFGSGQLDARGNPKPFFNVTVGKRNIATRATDIDRKDITMQAPDSDEYFRSFVASKFNHQLMKKMKMQDYLNDWGEALPTYGSVITKVVENKGGLHISVCDWMTTVCDPVDFESAPVIEKLSLTPAEMREKVSEGWDIDQIEELIEAKLEPRTNLKGKTVYQEPNFITVYEVHGRLPSAYLLKNPRAKDWKTYKRQMQVIGMHELKDDRMDFTLYKGKESKNPYSISHWKKTAGRTQGVGVVEDMFEPQIWTNYSVKQMKDQLDLASKTIYQTSDGNFAARNVLTNLQNGDFLIHAANSPVTPINVAPQGFESLQNLTMSWKQIGEDITSTPDAISGNTMPSGTAFRQVAMLNTEAHSYFDYITENKGNYLEDLYREYIIPYIIKQLDTADEIVAILSTEEIDWYDNACADRAEHDEIVKQTLAGNPVSPIQIAPIRQQKLADLKKTGAKRYLNPGKKGTWKSYFKGFEWVADINITGESQDKKTAIDTLFNALQLVATNPTILQNPATKGIFMQLLETSGVMSPLQMETAGAPQPSAPMQQPQPQQGQQPQQGNLQTPQPQGFPAPALAQ